jgi:hypothetical protein
MGYHNSTYPLAVYGCLDSASRKILWLRIWVCNSDPNLIGYWYLQHIFETTKIASYLRLDKGTETGTLATIHAFLRQYSYDGDPCDTILYGPSTSNQVSWYNDTYYSKVIGQDFIRNQSHNKLSRSRISFPTSVYSVYLWSFCDRLYSYILYMLDWTLVERNSRTFGEILQRNPRVAERQSALWTGWRNWQINEPMNCN